MNNINKGSVVIQDDFDNILIIQKKGKKSDKKVWSFIECNIKEKSVPENVILKEVNKQLKVTIFDLKVIDRLETKENDSKIIFGGIIREGIITHNEISRIEWVKKDKIRSYDFREEDKDVIELLAK